MVAAPPVAAPVAATTPAAIVFLDIDGVLNSVETRMSAPMSMSLIEASLPTPRLVSRLARLLHATPDSAIVLSSTWRNTRSEREYVEAALASGGIGPLFGDTPVTKHPVGGAADRAAEIVQWMSESAPASVVAWLALDDLNLHGWCPELIDQHHFELVNDAVGLSDANVDSAIAKLCQQRAPPSPPSPEQLVGGLSSGLSSVSPPEAQSLAASVSAARLERARARSRAMKAPEAPSTLLQMQRPCHEAS